MLTVNIAIGQVTPPVAANLYVAANHRAAADGDHGRRGVALRDGHARRARRCDALARALDLASRALQAALSAGIARDVRTESARMLRNQRKDYPFLVKSTGVGDTAETLETGKRPSHKSSYLTVARAVLV
jgi:hypothetical protein